jgi:hypothetical protein
MVTGLAALAVAQKSTMALTQELPTDGSRHIVLLGDSILDNEAYVEPGGSVVEQLRLLLPTGDRATLLARDGAVLASVEKQLAMLPEDASLLVISAGGNDALRSTSVLEEPAETVGNAVIELRRIQQQFALSYQSMLDVAPRPSIPVALCTIYDIQFEDAPMREAGNAALCLLNDVITRAAVARRLPVLDLRVIFSEPEDYANAIEPSAQGAAKLAKNILTLALNHEFDCPSAFYSS